MTTQTKALILERHRKNELLNAVSPPIISGEKNISTDEFYVPLDERIIASVAEALEAGQTHYVDVPGIPPLRGAIAEYLHTTFGSSYQQANVIVTAGVQESRFLTIHMIGEAFGRIAVPSVVHPGVHKALGVRSMPVDTLEVDVASGYLPSVDSIRKVLDNGSRLLYLESPSRLTGAAYGAQEVDTIAKLIADHDALVICDQGLAPWTESYASLVGHAALTERTVLIGEAFPGMGLSSWFIGYIAAPEARISSMQSQKQIMAICTSTASQYAALEASKLYAENQREHLERLSQKRSALQGAAAKTSLEVIAGSTATVLALRLVAERKSKALAQLEKAGYTVADGADFGAPHVLRITVSHSNAAENVLKLI